MILSTSFVVLILLLFESVHTHNNTQQHTHTHTRSTAWPRAASTRKDISQNKGGSSNPGSSGGLCLIPSLNSCCTMRTTVSGNCWARLRLQAEGRGGKREEERKRGIRGEERGGCEWMCLLCGCLWSIVHVLTQIRPLTLLSPLLSPLHVATAC